MVAPPRVIQVIYGRDNSCATQMTHEQIDWDIFMDTRLLHLTGITPALSGGCRDVVKDAVSRARAAGMPMSFDVNYRSKLWTPARAAEILLPLLRNSALLFCAKRDADLLFGISGTPEEVIQQLAEKTQAQHIVVSIGSAGVIGWDREHLFTNPPVK